MRRTIQLYWSNEYVQGGTFLIISSFIVNVLNYAFNFFAARVLGPSGYGELTAFYSYTALFSVPMAVFSSIIIQRISSHTVSPYAYAKSFATQFKHSVLYLLPFVLFGVLIIPFIIRVTNLSPMASSLLIPTILLGFTAHFYSSLFQGLKLFFLFSVLSIAGVVLRLISIFIPVFRYGALNEVFVFQFFASIFIFVISFWILSRILRDHAIKQSMPLILKLQRLMMSRQFIITLFSVLSFTLLSTSDIMFVKKFFTTGETGMYSSWSLFAKIILYIVGPITQISFVYFAGNAKKQTQDRVLLVSLGVLLCIGIIGTIGYTTVGSILISALFGARFLGVVPYLGLASIFGTFYAAISLLNTYFLAKKSRYALLLIILLPLYFITLFIIPKNLITIMWTNIVFSCIVACAYMGAFFLTTREIQS